MIKYIALIFILFTGDAWAKKKFKFFKGQKTQIDRPFDLRDPFRRNIKVGRVNKKKYGNKENTYTNVPTIDGVPLSSIKIVGVLLGKKRRAMAKVENAKEVIMLSEGMKIGENNAELKAILPGGIVLVEKIVNVYDQEEYLETVIPISEE